MSLVIAVISPAFQTRPFCVAELGAAWSQVGKLFPISVPGFQRTDMDGVMNGLIVKSLSDSSALDELHDLVSELLGNSSSAKTWGRYKANWMAKVDEYTRQLTSPRVIAAEDYDRALADLEGTRDALREAESVIQEQNKQIEQLISAKSADEIVEIILPKKEHERFNALVIQTQKELNKLPSIVRESIWYGFAYEAMPWPLEAEDYFVELESRRRTMENAVHDGWFIHYGDGVRPNDEFDEVRSALNAARQLDHFLRAGSSDSFKQWFRNEYNLPPDIKLKRVWRKLLTDSSCSASVRAVLHRG